MSEKPYTGKGRREGSSGAYRYYYPSQYSPHAAVSRAKTFAHAAHGDQSYGKDPYTKHLADVASVVEEFAFGKNVPPSLRVAAWLHDTVEDTDATIEDVRTEFGEEVASLVAAVSHGEGHPTRHERRLATYPRVRSAGTWAVYLKLCDRIANVRAAKKTAPDIYKRYQEDSLFDELLYKKGEHEDLWSELRSLL